MNNKFLREFVKYVSLNVIGMIGLSGYILADTFFVSQSQGTVGLAALNFSISIFSIMQGLGLMIGIGGATRFSIQRGSRNKREGNSAFFHSLIFGACVSMLFIIVAIFFNEPLALILGADKDTLIPTKTYLTTILSFSPFFIVNNIFIAFIRNDNNPKLSMIAMIVSSISNVVLDYIFMFPLSMGIFGAAFATGLSPIISLCILSAHFIKKKNSFQLQSSKFRVSSIIDIICLGFSSFVGELASAIALITFNLIIFKISGNIGVAAYGIIANIALIATAIFTGVAQGMQPIVSKSYGEQNKTSLRKVLRYASVVTIVLSVIIYSVIFIGAEEIIVLFNSEESSSLSAIAKQGLEIYFVGYLFAGANIVSAAFLSAITKGKEALIISMLRSCVIIVPIVIILSYFMQMNGVWLAFVLTEFITFIISTVTLVKENRVL